MALSGDEIDAFVTDGFVRLEAAVSSDVAAACRDELWTASGYDRLDPGTWTDTLVRIDGLSSAPFRAAAQAPALIEAFDQLVGPGRWAPRTGLGTFPLRFPGRGEAKEAGWHIEASFAGPDGGWRVNLRSRGRALLMLFLFSEVGEQDAPTLLRVGSHLDVPALLASHGHDGLDWMSACRLAVHASAGRATTAATGSPGDVYLCHPFVVHRGQAHRGTTPRFMAQPPLEPVGELDLETHSLSPVARAVVLGLEALSGAPDSAGAVLGRPG